MQLNLNAAAAVEYVDEPVSLPRSDTAPIVLVEPKAVRGSRTTPDALKIALRLREMLTKRSGTMVVFVPAGESGSVAQLVRETSIALQEIGEFPVLVLDLVGDAASAATLGSLSPMSIVSIEQALAAVGPRPSGADDLHTLVVARPSPGDAGVIPYFSSREFATLLEQVRRQFAFILCVTGPASVESLLLAGRSDGVVLSVDAERSTISEAQRAADQLRQINAPLLGFVMDRAQSLRRKTTWLKR